MRFLVYDNQGPAKQWPLVHAHLVAADDTAVRGEVTCASGAINCRKKGSQAVGLCLQYDAGPMGVLMLQTCLLPEREEPYVLSVELARHRIKMFIAKSEEWQMFDLSPEHPAMTLWEEARRLLTQALVMEDPIKADRAARSALVKGIDASERLAMAHAEILLYRRYGQKAAGAGTLGVRVPVKHDAQALKDVVAKDFDVVVIPLRWSDMEVQEGKYDWDATDKWMDWASRQRKPIVAGPLLNFTKAALPKWIYVWQHDYDTTRDLAYDHVAKLVDRYKSVVSIWNVACGLNVNDHFQFTIEQMIDLARMAVLAAKQSRAGARTMVELSNPFGEYSASNRDAVPPLTFIDRLVQEGVKLDAIGVQLQFGAGEGGRAARDLACISSLLDRFVLLETPVLISALGVPSAPGDAQGGTWHQTWSDDVQTKWVSRVFPLLLSKPFVESVFWAELVDHEASDVQAIGLMNEKGEAKPALAKLTGLRRRLKKPLGTINLPFKSAGATGGAAT